MNWLIKENPKKLSFSDFLEKWDSVTWTKVTNYQARNNIREMSVGDLVLYYHSGKERSIVGLSKVASAPRPNPNYDTWTFIDFEPYKKLKRPVQLNEIKSDDYFADFQLVKQGRLSVVPVPDEYFDKIIAMSEET
jgi:predicted RNA-binding protein with PUA-like domain